MPKRKFTPEEIDYIIVNYADNYTQVLADKLQCSLGKIYNTAWSLGLHKSERWKAEDKVFRSDLLEKTGKKFRFTKGHIPANKGKKMSDEVKAKYKHTWFEKE